MLPQQGMQSRNLGRVQSVGVSKVSRPEPAKERRSLLDQKHRVSQLFTATINYIIVIFPYFLFLS